MAQEFSWLRFWQAIKDAWSLTKEAKDKAMRTVEILAVFGYGVGAAWKPEVFLPSSIWGRIGIGILLFLMFTAQVRIAYRLRCQLDALLAIPESDRNLILELKTVAGEAVHHCTALLSFSSKDQADESVRQLRTILSKLRQYPGIYSAATRLSDALAWWSGGHIIAPEYKEAVKWVETIYQRVLTECDAVLKPTKDLVPTRATEQFPPSSPESSESKNASK